jgi:hypothetical protein
MIAHEKLSRPTRARRGRRARQDLKESVLAAVNGYFEDVCYEYDNGRSRAYDKAQEGADDSV